MITIEPFTQANAEADAEALKDLFRELNDTLAALGMDPPLTPGGEAEWLRTLRPMLGRLTFIHLARQDGVPQGFVAGHVRNMPSYLGGDRIGVLSHIHVRPSLRGQGAGKQLLAAFTDAMKAQGITRLETDVLMDNTAARTFFESSGFDTHHLILRKPLV